MANIIGTKGNDTLLGSNNTDTIKGLAGNDTITVSQGNNLLSGGDGNDNLLAFGNYDAYRGSISFGNPIIGNNTLNGGAGNDNLNAIYSTGNNLLYGDAGDDNLSVAFSTGNNLLSGGNGNDYLSVSGSHDQQNGTIERYYGSGNNTLNGGAGNDVLDASYTTGNNTLNGGAGDDRLYVSNAEGNNLLSGGNGDDSFYVGIQYNYNGDGNNPYTDPSSLVTQTVDGGIGDDLLSGDYTSYPLVTGGITTTFNPTTNIGSITKATNRVSYKNIERLNISGTAYDDLIVGSNGNDTLFGGYDGKDTIDGGLGDDVLSASYVNSNEGEGITTSFNATTKIGSITAGTNGVSYKNIERLNISGTAYDDLIVGSNGNDTLSTGYGNDTIDGSLGDDLLSVNYRDATKKITSTFNATTNIGSITAGKDRVSYKNIEQLNIRGTAYEDLIVGSNGNDTLDGGSGNDILTGGNGNDIFVFYDFNGGIDRLDDFNATNELIQVSSAGFGFGLSLGSLETSKFIIGASATTNQEQFIYNSATGGLFFDLDGSASEFTQVQIAQLSTGLSVSENNFVVV